MNQGKGRNACSAGSICDDRRRHAEARPASRRCLWLLCSLRRTLADVANHKTAVLGESYDVFVCVHNGVTMYIYVRSDSSNLRGRSIILSSRSGVVVVMECSLQVPDRALTTCRHPTPSMGLQFSVCSSILCAVACCCPLSHFTRGIRRLPEQPALRALLSPRARPTVWHSEQADAPSLGCCRPAQNSSHRWRL